MVLFLSLSLRAEQFHCLYEKHWTSLVFYAFCWRNWEAGTFKQMAIKIEIFIVMDERFVYKYAFDSLSDLCYKATRSVLGVM